MTPQEAVPHILNGRTVKMVVGGYDPDDPVLLIYVEDDMFMQTAIGGWSQGVTEPICDIDSDFILSHLDGKSLTLTPTCFTLAR